MDNSINFKGAFLLTKPTKAVKNDILPKLGKHRQIFNDFVQEGDVLYITRKGSDKRVAEFLTHHRTKFKYYPELSTKSGFDDEKPLEAKKILDEYKSAVISTVAGLKELFKVKPQKELPAYVSKGDNTLEKTLKALDIDIEKHIIKRRDGYTEVYTKDKELVASISGPGKYGFRYVRLEPKNPKDPNDEVKRYAIRDGKKQFTYVNSPDENVANGTAAFLKNYIKAVKSNRAVTHSEAHQ
jgi:hypothetical protein